MKDVVLFFPRPWPGRGMAGRIPLSLLHLYSYLKNDNFKIKIVDERLVPDMPSLIKGLGKNILCFGISSFTGIQISNGINIARQLKAEYPRTLIVWGGWHPSCMPEQTLRHSLVDIVVRGQGEETFRELLYALASQKPLSDVRGIAYKDNGKFYCNPERELLPVLENLRVSYDIVDVDRYIFKQPWGDRAIGIITSLGCPFSCGFCAIANIYKRRTFFRNVDFVFEDIDYLVDRYKINAITFDDDNFFISPKRVKEFCRKLIDRPYRIAWDAGAHVGLLLKNYDDETLKLVRESGCKQLYIGAESGSDEVLNIINKKAAVHQTFKFVRKMREVGIGSFLSTMVCFPGVSAEDIYATMDMIIKCRDIDPNLGFRLFYYTPYPATALYRTALKMGMKEPESLEDWSGHTLRKFKAPWIKRSYRRQMRYFYFYYFPYSSNRSLNWDYSDKSRVESVLLKIYNLIFANRWLMKLARWRVKNGNYKFPLDAYFVIQGERLKSLYSKLVYRVPDLFCDYED